MLPPAAPVPSPAPDPDLPPPAAAAAPGGALVAVIGASGYVGSNLVPRLLQEPGVRVRACARNGAAMHARGWSGVEVVEADVLRPETLPAALAGVDTAYYLVHSMAGGSDFGERDLRGAEHFAAAAAAAGVRRIVYLGGLIPAQPESEHLVSRRDTGERLRRGPVPVTEIRAGIIVGPGSAAYEVIRDIVNHLPLLLTPTWVRSKSSPIALANLLEYLVRVRTIESAAGGIFDAGGADTLSYEDVIRAYGRAVGRRTRIVHVPLMSPRLSSYGLGLVTAVPASVARALIGGLRHDLPADDRALRALVPQRLLGVDEMIAAALQAEREHRVAARWTEGLMMFRGFSIDNAYYAKRAGGSALAAAGPEAVWRVVATLGGRNGYFYMGWLWWLRSLLDWLVGGPGFTHGRRHPTELRLGDRIDYWTVLAIEPPRHLTLHFGMRAPGAGVLEFEVVPLAPGQTRLTVTAYWHPQGVWGLLYWYVLVPAHLFIFKGMTAEMARRAEALERAGPTALT